MTDTLPKETIIEATRGNPQALELVIVAAEKTMRQIASAVPAADADDVVQNSLIRLTNSIGHLGDPQAFSAWVSTITRNEMRMFHRSRFRRHQAQMQFGFEPHLEREQTSSPDLRSAIGRLPSSQQLIINQLYVKDHSYAEIAEQLELPVSAVKSRLHRARNRLKKEMKLESTTPTMTLSKKDIESLQQAARFRHQGDDRENLTGVYLDKDGFAIGTDGHHLVIRSIPTLTSLDSNLLINPTSLIEVHEAATLSVHMDEVQLQTTTDKLAFSISEQQFPDYHSILPEDQPTVCSLNKNDLLVMLGSANEALASQSDTSRTVMITLDLEQEKFSLDSNHITSPDSHSSFHSSVAISQPNNRLGILKVAVNLDLLLDCITAVDGDLVAVKGTAWNKPLDIVGEQHRAVLMPIKL